MRKALFALAAVLLTASPALGLISVTVVDSPDEVPKHLTFRTSPAQDNLINVWVTIIEPKPDDVKIWASLSTKLGGKLLSRANLVSHRQKEGFSVSFQMPKEAFDESSVMISVRGADREDVGYEIQLAIFKP